MLFLCSFLAYVCTLPTTSLSLRSEKHVKMLDKLLEVKESDVRARVDAEEIEIVDPSVYDDIDEMRAELENRGERTTVSQRATHVKLSPQPGAHFKPATFTTRRAISWR